MTRKITIIAMLVFVSTNIFAQRYYHDRDIEKELSFNNGIEEPEVNTKYGQQQSMFTIQNEMVNLKSANLLEEKLDSVITQEYDENIGQLVFKTKEEYAYDARGNRTHDISYEWDMITDQWLAKFKKEYIYNVNDYMTLRLRYVRNEITGVWDTLSKRENNFDPLGNVTTRLVYHMDENKNWIS